MGETLQAWRMGHVGRGMSHPESLELPLPWGPVVRGVCWGAGPDTVLLLHEPGADIDAWGALPSRLASILGIEVIAVDLPGHGLSDDPWQPERLGEVIRVLVQDSASSPLCSLTSPPPPTTAVDEKDGTGSGSGQPHGRQFVVAAGSVASTVLSIATDLRLAGLVALSPTAYPEPYPGSQAGDPSPPIAMRAGSALGGGRGVRATLYLAGSLADSDLDDARRMASTSSGWTVVTSVPVSARGTGLIAGRWHARVAEEITAFLRDCLRPRPTMRTTPRVLPR